MTEDSKARFCRRLKSCRKANKMTLEQLGVAIGLEESSASTRISRYENGIHIAEPYTVERIANVLGVPMAYFYADDDEIAELLYYFHQLNHEQRKEILNIIHQVKNTEESSTSNP